VRNEAYLIAGLAYGDEGKGATTDFLVRQRRAGLVVRYNGGAQAGHNVISPDGRHHTFSQFGSGTFVDGVKTHLSRHVLINPLSMMEEAKHLCSLGIGDVWDRLTVEGDSLVITPFQRAVNRILEASRGHLRHGSCGMGIGETRSDHLSYGNKVLFAKDLKNESLTREKLAFLQKISRDKVSKVCMKVGKNRLSRAWEVLAAKAAIDWCWREYEQWPGTVVDGDHLAILLDESPVTVFEGAQGVLLDEKWGEPNHNTWTDCTFGNADSLLKNLKYNGIKRRIGVIRSYFTRHGAGNFRTEDKNLKFTDHNKTEDFQGEFRFGYLDIPALEYSLQATGPVYMIAMNHLDHCADYEQGKKLVEYVEKELKTHVGIIGFGQTANFREFRY